VASETASQTCEHRFWSREVCGSPASYVVSVGHRKHDAQRSCRRHLTATVDALVQAEDRDADIVVRKTRRGR
jgi:hypothetical protein